MVHRYVPILRWKRGEKVAVQQLSAAGRRDVLPLFIVGSERYVGREATRNRPAIAPADVVASELERYWGRAPFYLDASAIAVGPARQHPLVAIAARARALGLNLIPATQLDAPPQYQAAVAVVMRADGRGVLLNVDLQEFSSAARWVGNLSHQPADTDLLVDFADNVAVVAALGNAVDQAFQNLHIGRQWRTVTMSGTSMPENFMGFVAGSHLVTRNETGLWRHLSGARLPYRLDYGDYATVAVVPAPAGIKWGYPINVRYTLDHEFLVCRGVRTTGPNAVDADVQLRGHAQAIFGHRARQPLAGCWADTRIDNINAGVEPPRGLEHWVQIGVNRHIELTRNRVP